MKTYFELNKRRYEAKEFDFNTVCDLSEMGIDFEKIQKAPAPAIRAYLAICMDADKDIAGREIQAHILGGGNLDEVAKVMAEMLDKSDFFQALNKSEETTTPAKKTKKEKEE